MSDQLIRIAAGDGWIHGYFIQHTQVVEMARQVHQTSPVATAALGRSMGAALMMSQMMKNKSEKLTLRINGGGPIGTILCVANQNGSVKGLVDFPQAETINKAPGKMDVGAAVGTQGELTVIRDMGLKKPYIGNSPLTTGEIAEDLTHYFLQSEQQPSSVGLSVLVDVDYRVMGAGGFIIQVMPDIPESVLGDLERQLISLKPVSEILQKRNDAMYLLDAVLGPFRPRVTDEIIPVFQCDCSRERMEKALVSLGEKELREIIDEDGGAETTCHFCLKAYHFDGRQLETLLKEAKSR